MGGTIQDIVLSYSASRNGIDGRGLTLGVIDQPFRQMVESEFEQRFQKAIGLGENYLVEDLAELSSPLLSQYDGRVGAEQLYKAVRTSLNQMKRSALEHYVQNSYVDGDVFENVMTPFGVLIKAVQNQEITSHPIYQEIARNLQASEFAGRTARNY